jgi:DNA-binding NtrC family response regulator
MAKILIADRDTQILALLSEIFSIYGYDCTCQSDPDLDFGFFASAEKGSMIIADIFFVNQLLHLDKAGLERLLLNHNYLFVMSAREPLRKEIELLFNLNAPFYEKPLTPFTILEFIEKALELLPLNNPLTTDLNDKTDVWTIWNRCFEGRK